MNSRHTAVPAPGPSGKTMWALRMTNSKKEKWAMAVPMNAPTSLPPIRRNGSPARRSMTTTASGRKSASSSGQARRLTTSA